MKSTLLTLMALFIFAGMTAQLEITEPSGGEALNGSVVLVPGSQSVFELVHEFFITNTSSESYTVGCRRIELDAQAGLGMMSTLCWVICPAYVDVGAMPTRTSSFEATLAPGQIDSSFAMHLRPNGVDGCTSYRIEWFNVDDDTEVLASVDMLYNHSSSSCVTSIDEFADLNTSLSPNPANDIATLSLSGVVKPLDIRVFDLLGKTVSNEQFNPSYGNQYLIDTSSMINGIYFVSIQSESRVLKTIKLVVRR